MSRFDKIFEARETEAITEQKNGNNKPAKKKNDGNEKNNKNIRQTDSSASDASARPIIRTDKKRGRPPAKRSDPNFVGLTTYVRRDTHMRAKIALLQEGEGRELSHLVEDLIYKWLNEK